MVTVLSEQSFYVFLFASALVCLGWAGYMAYEISKSPILDDNGNFVPQKSKKP